MLRRWRAEDPADDWPRYHDALELQSCEVRYEALVAGFEPTVRQALAPLGLSWSEEMRDFHRNAGTRHITTPSRGQVTQPLNRGSLARWRQYEPEIAAVEPILAAALFDGRY